MPTRKNLQGIILVVVSVVTLVANVRGGFETA